MTSIACAWPGERIGEKVLSLPCLESTRRAILISGTPLSLLNLSAGGRWKFIRHEILWPQNPSGTTERHRDRMSYLLSKHFSPRGTHCLLSLPVIICLEYVHIARKAYRCCRNDCKFRPRFEYPICF